MNKKLLIIALSVVALGLLIYIAVLIFTKPAPTDIITNTMVEVQPQSQALDMQGLKIEILKEGNGSEAKKDDRVIISYVGMFKEGTVFSSNLGKDPLTFVLGENDVIKGWELGVLGMKVGEKRRLIIPSSLAYGKKGKPPLIGPNMPLVFELELLGILVK